MKDEGKKTNNRQYNVIHRRKEEKANSATRKMRESEREKLKHFGKKRFEKTKEKTENFKHEE